MTRNQAGIQQGVTAGRQFAATAHSDEVPPLTDASRDAAAPAGHDFYPPAAEMTKWQKIYTNDEIDCPDKPIMAHYVRGAAERGGLAGHRI